MTTEVDVQEKPRRNYTGSQVFPVVAALMFGVSVLIWLIVLQARVGRTAARGAVAGRRHPAGRFSGRRVVPAADRGPPGNAAGQRLGTADGAGPFAAAGVDGGVDPRRGRRLGLPDSPGQLAQHRGEPVVHHCRDRHRGTGHAADHRSGQPDRHQIPGRGARRPRRCADVGGGRRADLPAAGSCRAAASGDRPVDAVRRRDRHVRAGRVHRLAGRVRTGPSSASRWPPCSASSTAPISCSCASTPT